MLKPATRMLAIVLVWIHLVPAICHACTTVLISGRVTSDGRPLLWKNRDTWQQQNEVLYDESGKYAFIGIVNAEAQRSVWMGTNSAGFCIENSLSKDLRGNQGVRGGLGNGSLIRRALTTCASVAEFRQLLDETNSPGRRTQGNFGVIDADGNAVMFEVGPNSYQSFDANDPKVAPNGIIVRANASILGSSRESKPADVASELAASPLLERDYSSKRYCRARDLCERSLSSGKIDLRYLLQDVARDIEVIQDSEPSAESAFNTTRTLNRNTTVSAVVFHGVRKDEPAVRTTMWTLLGEPAFSIAIPSWVAQGDVALPLNGHGSSSICELSMELRRRNYQIGVSRSQDRLMTTNLAKVEQGTLAVENATLAKVLPALDSESTELDSEQLWRMHSQAADDALAGLAQLCQVVDNRRRTRSTKPRITADFPFDDADDTKLAETENVAGEQAWSGGLSDSRVLEGSFRIRRNEPSRINRFVDVSPNVRVTSDNAGLPKVHRGWIVMEVDGWNLVGDETGEAIRIGFVSRPKQDIHTAGLEIRRTGDDKVQVRGVGFGDGATDITVSQEWHAKQSSPVTFVLELDKILGNNGEGDAGGAYRIYAKSDSIAGRAAYKPLGAAGKVRRLRNGNHVGLHVEGNFGDDDEYFDIGRIYYTVTSPIR